MISRPLLVLSGVMLCLAGTAYVLDTVLDILVVHGNPGLGAAVPILGLIGFPGFWLSLDTRGLKRMSLAAYGIAMLGLAGFVIVTFLNNRLFPGLNSDAVGSILTIVGPEFLAVGVTFLLSALLMLPICWRAGPAYRFGAILYAAGAIPVSLPPLMPEAAVTGGGLAVGTGLLVWGAALILTKNMPRTVDLSPSTT